MYTARVHTRFPTLDRGDFEKLVSIVQQVLGSKFSGLVTNSFSISKSALVSDGEGSKITNLKSLSKGQVRLNITRPTANKTKDKLPEIQQNHVVLQWDGDGKNPSPFPKNPRKSLI